MYEQGIEQGIKANMVEIIQRMLANGKDMQEIADVIGLSEDEIKELIK